MQSFATKAAAEASGDVQVRARDSCTRNEGTKRARTSRLTPGTSNTFGPIQIQLPLKLYGVPGRYASAMFVAASKAKKLDLVEKELKTVRDAGNADAGSSNGAVRTRNGRTDRSNQSFGNGGRLQAWCKRVLPLRTIWAIQRCCERRKAKESLN